MKNLQVKFLTNKNTIRWLKILKLFESARSCSLQEISNKTHISTRTIIKEIKEIKLYFGESIAVKTNNLGYIFNEENYSRYSELKRNLVKEDPLFVIVESILTGKIKNTDEWAFTFHLSESTMKRYLLSIVSVLKEYNIQLSLDPVDFVGSEVNIRKFFKDFYYEVDITPHTILPFQELKEIISDLNDENGLRLHTNVSPADFRYFLYIMIQRSKNGKGIGLVKPTVNYTNREKELLQNLRKNIFKVFGYEINDDELLVIYIYCMSQRRIILLDTEKKYCLRFSHGMEEKKIAERFLVHYDKKMYNAKSDILYFIEAFFVSMRWLDSLGSIMNRNLSTVLDFAKDLYPEKYDLTLKILEENHVDLHIENTYLKDIAASLMLTVESIRDMYFKNPRNIAVMLEGSYYINRILRAKMYRYLSGYHKLYFPTIEDLNLSYFKEHSIDLFVTNEEEYITELVRNIDFLVFKAVPDNSDWNQLLTKINSRIAQDFNISNTGLN